MNRGIDEDRYEMIADALAELASELDFETDVYDLDVDKLRELAEVAYPLAMAAKAALDEIDHEDEVAKSWPY